MALEKSLISTFNEKLKCLKKDFEMLRDDIWQPDKDSVQASLDNVEWMLNNINKLTKKQKQLK